MSKLRDAQDEFIAEEALNLFLEQSIGSVTIAEIAKEVGVGEATLYRHFKTKQNIVIRSAIILSKRVETNDFEPTGKNGFEKLKNFYETYIRVYEKHREYFSFINEFDAFALSEGFDAKGYDDELASFKDLYVEAYEQGLRDHSVAKVQNLDVFYYSTTHSMMSLCKKLSQKTILTSDLAINPKDEIETMIDTILFRLKAR